jgi:xanthine dehydrogenase molybdenum-binding subunit
MVLADKPEYKVIGTRPIRHDGADKVTGRAQYGADITLPGTLFGKVLRSPYAHARIIAIDTSKAEALPGVKAVITHKDFPAAPEGSIDLGEGAANLKELQDNVLASDKALYRGHPIAAVAATNIHIAEEAIGLIEVEWEVLPPVVNVRDAMRADAPLLDESRHTKSLAGLSEKPSNIAQHMQFKQGDVDAALAEADFIVEREFETVMVHQGYIEPHASSAMWSSDGRLTVYTSTQGSFAVRGAVAGVLLLPVAQVKVVPTEIGGGFGGKLVIYLEPLCALLSKKTAKPVKMWMTRTEVFESTGPTSGTYITIKAGAKNDGTITGVQAMLAYEAGAYAGSSVGAGMMCMLAPYDINNLVIDGYDVVVNKPKTAAYRAPGAPAAGFAFEQVVDEIAERTGVDPLRLRLQQTAREGTKMSTGAPFARIGHEECVEAALASPHYKTPLEGPNRGRGVASGFWMNVGLKSSVTASINPDGTVSLMEGSIDIGGTRSSIAMQLAETLGIRAEDVRPTVVDTDSVGYNDVTGGSRTTFASGYAAYEAANDLIVKMKARLADAWKVEASAIEYKNGTLSTSGDDAKTMSFKEFAAQMFKTGPAVVGVGSVQPRGVGSAYSTQICDVEVDPDTGKVTVLRYTVVQDAGTAIHPAYVEGQMQGGVAQGIGWALNEEYFYDDSGRMVNASYLDYRMPTALDLPLIETVIVEVPNPGHPFGVRGVGEVPIVPPLAAVANAVYRATGHRFTKLPINPARILEATLGLEAD